MPVCWFCGENVPDVTKCLKCGLDYCELHINQHDCPGVPVTNPYNISVEIPAPIPTTESESFPQDDEKAEAAGTTADLELKKEKTQPAQEKTPTEVDAVAKTV